MSRVEVRIPVADVDWIAVGIREREVVTRLRCDDLADLDVVAAQAGTFAAVIFDLRPLVPPSSSHASSTPHEASLSDSTVSLTVDMSVSITSDATGKAVALETLEIVHEGFLDD